MKTISIAIQAKQSAASDKAELEEIAADETAKFDAAIEAGKAAVAALTAAGVEIESATASLVPRAGSHEPTQRVSLTA